MYIDHTSLVHVHAQVWADTIAGAGLERVEVGAGISDLLAAKSDVEVLCSRKAGYLSAQVMEKFLVKKLEDTVSKGLKVKHSELSRQAEESIQDPVKIQVSQSGRPGCFRDTSCIPIWRRLITPQHSTSSDLPPVSLAQVKLKKELCDIAYYPVVQSGGAYDIKLAAATDDATLHAGVIVFAIGAKYQVRISAPYMQLHMQRYTHTRTDMCYTCHVLFCKRPRTEMLFHSSLPGLLRQPRPHLLCGRQARGRGAVSCAGQDAGDDGRGAHRGRGAGRGVRKGPRVSAGERPGGAHPLAAQEPGVRNGTGAQVRRGVGAGERKMGKGAAPRRVEHFFLSLLISVCLAVMRLMSYICAIRPELSPIRRPSLPRPSLSTCRDNHLVIGPKCLARARAGMTFVIAVGVAPTALEGERNPKRATYAISLADTFLVKPGGAGAEIITGESKRSFGDVAYNLEGGAEEDEAKPAANDGKRLRSDAGIVQNEAVRRKKQEQLAGQVNQSTLERLQAAKTKMEGGAGQAAARTAESMVSYRALGDVPPRPTLTVQVDHDRQTLLLPLYGMLVPFHIATVKTVTASDTADKDQTVIRIIFNVPGSHAGKAYDPAAKFPTCTFIKELSFKSADKKGADKVVQEVKALQRQATAKDREVLQRASLVQQEKLTIAKGRIPSLRDVWVRPTLGGRGRKVPGTLDAHVNGFRYATPRTEEVIDVLYSNIKHAFFQPVRWGRGERSLCSLVSDCGGRADAVQCRGTDGWIVVLTSSCAFPRPSLFSPPPPIGREGGDDHDPLPSA